MAHSDDRHRDARDSSRVRIVLACPDENRNIGSVCRAMKTMGIDELAIVPCGRQYDSTEVAVTAVHAFDVFEHARFFDTLSEAVQDCALAVAYTRRQGRQRKMSTVSPEEVARRVVQLGPAEEGGGGNERGGETGQANTRANGRRGEAGQAGASRGPGGGNESSGGVTGSDRFTASGKLALVFGNEEHGLTNEQTASCHLACTIPTSPQYPSLNLAQAVQIACYAIFREMESSTSQPVTPIQAFDIEALADEVSAIVAQVGYAGSYDRQTSRTFIRDILARSALSPREARRLRSLLRKMRFRS